jgi:hypothetical protein
VNREPATYVGVHFLWTAKDSSNKTVPCSDSFALLTLAKLVQGD